MGTLVRLIIYASDTAAAEEAAAKAFSRIEDLNAVMSDYHSESELMQLARGVVGNSTEVSRDLYHVLSRARQISELSDGAFDVTVGAVAALWRDARAVRELPPPAAIEEAMGVTGYEKLELLPSDEKVKLLMPGMGLDLGGIGKGYAAQEALEVLRAEGMPRSMVAVSGDLAIGEAPPGEAGWAIGVTSGGKGEGAVSEVLLLSNAAVSTSGDTEQFVEIGGVRYSHIVDPRTGLGLTEQIQVTVVAPDSMTADGLATAISVLGAEKGLALAESLSGVECLILKAGPSGTEKLESSFFARHRR